ncbi:hypothetical protein [Prescottella subtropica]|uniref:hypothetical protein n=1 Tax=Prescottella subtropica TaxID=2545757 RepID=UPI0019D4F409|nr:hypothetical protein [Prescottella subtropica]
MTDMDGLRALLQCDEPISEALPAVFPWMAVLSHEETQEFEAELVGTLRAADSLDDPAAAVQVIEAWQHTAEVVADPELTAALTADTAGDFGAVPAPDVR